MLNLIPWKRGTSPAEGTWMYPLDPARSELNQLVNRWMEGLPASGLLEDPVRIDVRETAEAVIVRAEVPGIDPKDLEIQLVGDLLSIAGEKKDERREDERGCVYSERRYGSFRRTLRLATPLDAEKVRAEHRNGVVTVTLAKSEASRPRRIEVQGG